MLEEMRPRVPGVEPKWLLPYQSTWKLNATPYTLGCMRTKFTPLADIQHLSRW